MTESGSRVQAQGLSVRAGAAPKVDVVWRAERDEVDCNLRADLPSVTPPSQKQKSIRTLTGLSHFCW